MSDSSYNSKEPEVTVSTLSASLTVNTAKEPIKINVYYVTELDLEKLSTTSDADTCFNLFSATVSWALAGWLALASSPGIRFATAWTGGSIACSVLAGFFLWMWYKKKPDRHKVLEKIRRSVARRADPL